MGFFFFLAWVSIFFLLIGAVILILKILQWIGVRSPRIFQEYLNIILSTYPISKIFGGIFATMRFIKNRGQVFAILFFLFSYYWMMLNTGLPSDELMIAKFQKNYPDIEKLVHSYRFYEASPDDPNIHYGWEEKQDVKNLLNKTDVYNVSYLLLGYWLPEPYSVETAKIAEDMFQLELKDGRLYSMAYKYHPIQVSLSPRVEYINSSSTYILVWKRFMYFPEPPHIENGYLLGPVDKKGNHNYKIRVMSSLNQFPFYFKNRECVYRKINPHWFLSLCNGH